MHVPCISYREIKRYMKHRNQVIKYGPKNLLSTKEAAPILACAEITLHMSRWKGTLFGLPAPAYEKRGRNVFYRRSTLDAFNAQFHEQANTAA